MNQIKLPEIPHGIHLTNFFPPLQLSVWDELSSGSFKRLAQLQLQFAGAESKHEPELYQFCSFCKHTCCGCQMLSKSTQNPESKRKTLTCCSIIYNLPPIRSILCAELSVGQSPPWPLFPHTYWEGTGKQKLSREGYVSHARCMSPGSTSSPRAVWAADKTTISSRIPQKCWIRQAVKYHYTRVADSKDQFRLP